jgi:hypothetical protein
MPRTTKRLSVVIAACLVGAFGIAGALGIAAAQSPGVNPLPQEPVLTASELAALTPQDMLKKADSYLQAMELGATTVRRQLEKAREARDVVKSLCLNDKLTQINVALRSASERHGVLKLAVERDDVERARHEFTVLEVLRDRLRTLVTEANQCIGEEAGFVGESRVTVEVDPGLPEEEESPFPDEPILSVPPLLASYTQ